MSQLTLQTQMRSTLGSAATRRYRRQGMAPVIVYGSDKPNESMLTEENKLNQLLAKEAAHSAVIKIKCGSKSQNVILRAVQRHPYKPIVMHADFQRVDQKTALHITIPIHVTGADNAPGIKVSGGILSQLLTEIDISCLPKDLPEFLEIDISELERNESLHISDLKLPSGVKLTDQHEAFQGQTIVSILSPATEEAEETVTEEVEEESS